MSKLIELLLIAGIACRMFSGRWPWQLMAPARRPRGGDEMARARALLGVSDKAAREDILDAHKRLILAVHPDRGGSNALANEANTARDLLLADIAHAQKGQA